MLAFLVAARLADPIVSLQPYQFAIDTFDGTGAHSPARQTIRRNGVPTADLFADPPVDGPYEVDPDCAGRLLNFDGTVAGHFVVVDGGKEIFNISLRPGNSVIGVFRKID